MIDEAIRVRLFTVGQKLGHVFHVDLGVVPWFHYLDYPGVGKGLLLAPRRKKKTLFLQIALYSRSPDVDTVIMA